MEESDHSSNSCHTDSLLGLRENYLFDSYLHSKQSLRSRVIINGMREPHSTIKFMSETSRLWNMFSDLGRDLAQSRASLSASIEKRLQSLKENTKLISEEVANSTGEAAEPSEFFHKLFRYICHVTRLLMLLCLFYAAKGKTKGRFKYTYEKAPLLILWQCGDVERNPGPGPHTISDISRDFCKKIISLLNIQYWERKEGRHLTQADYKKRPEEWEEDIWYGNPSKCTNKDRNAMLKGLCDTCLVQEDAIQNDWLVLIDKYERSKDKRCSKTEKTKHAKSLQSWLHQQRILEDARHVLERLNEDSEQDNFCIVELLYEGLKQLLPDLTSKIYESRKKENEPVMSQDPGVLGQCSHTYLSVNGNVPSEHNTIHADGRKEEIYNSISAQNKLMATQNESLHSTANPVADIHENGITTESTLQADSIHDDQGYSEDFFADNVISRVDYLTAYTEETNRNCSKACKRKNTPHDGLDITETVSLSKRQKSSSEMDFSQSTEIRLGSTGRVGVEVTNYTTSYTPRNKEESYDGTDITLDDLMDIIQSEIQEDTIRPEDVPDSDLDIFIDDDILFDVKGLNKYLFG